jgi:hypothetical protein
VKSKRFQPSGLIKWLVPTLLVLLTAGLLATLVLVGLSLAGIKAAR